jgi:hypothetical protein
MFLIFQTVAEKDILKVTEGNLELQKVSLNGITKRLSDKMYGFILKHYGFSRATTYWIIP